MESGGRGEFLPPQPPGPEPQLVEPGAPPAAEPPPPAGEPPPPAQSPPPPGWQGEGWQAGWQQPPPPWPYYRPGPPEPDNGAAVAGFVTSVVSGALLVMTFGFVCVLTLVAAPFGIHYSRKGKRAVDEGRTRKHRGLAQAGFVIGIVTLVLSLFATAGWIIVLVAAINDAQDGGDGGGGPFDSTSAALALGALRLAAGLLA